MIVPKPTALIIDVTMSRSTNTSSVAFKYTSSAMSNVK